VFLSVCGLDKIFWFHFMLCWKISVCSDGAGATCYFLLIFKILQYKKVNTFLLRKGVRLSCIRNVYARCINFLFAPLPFRYTPHPWASHIALESPRRCTARPEPLLPLSHDSILTVNLTLFLLPVVVLRWTLWWCSGDVRRPVRFDGDGEILRFFFF
jgi:hypothetical protein